MRGGEIWEEGGEGTSGGAPNDVIFVMAARMNGSARGLTRQPLLLVRLPTPRADGFPSSWRARHLSTSTRSGLPHPLNTSLSHTVKTLSIYGKVQFVNAVHDEVDGLVSSSRNRTRL